VRFSSGSFYSHVSQQQGHHFQVAFQASQAETSEVVVHRLGDINPLVIQQQRHHFLMAFPTGGDERGAPSSARLADVDSHVAQEQFDHLNVTLLASNQEGSRPSLVSCVGLQLWVLEEDFCNLKMAEAAGTVKRRVIFNGANPVDVKSRDLSWVTEEELDKAMIAFRTGIPQT